MAKVELKAPVVAEISEAIKDAQSVAVSYTHLLCLFRGDCAEDFRHHA